QAWQVVMQVPLQHWLPFMHAAPVAPHSVQTGPTNGPGDTPHRFGGTGVSNGSSRQLTNPNCFITGSMLGRPQIGLRSGAKQLGYASCLIPVAHANSLACSPVGSSITTLGSLMSPFCRNSRRDRS